ncbi:hypothetical protein PBY51_001295 [Eleginops maclovinus]|uniref:Uncharacterized protein n=1 Tax=Eleginops maclovinus TaxID=56733 RepID=A0AAN7WW60_ELEMC|nr:hypothetical protein PBY51_001295 [Eleginops maclovinus]
MVLVLLSKNCVMPLPRKNLCQDLCNHQPLSIEGTVNPSWHGGGFEGFCARLSSNRFLRFEEARRDASMTRLP